MTRSGDKAPAAPDKTQCAAIYARPRDSAALGPAAHPPPRQRRPKAVSGSARGGGQVGRLRPAAVGRRSCARGGGAVSCHLGRPQPAGADTPQQPALAGGGGGHSVGPSAAGPRWPSASAGLLALQPRIPSAEGVLVKEIQRGGGQALLRVGKGEERAAGREQPRSSQQQTQRKPPLRAASAHSPHVAVERALSGPLPATSLAGPGRVEIFNLSSRKSEGVSRSHSGLLAIGSQSSGILRWDHVEARHQSQPMVGPCRGRRSTSRSLPCWLEEYDLFQFYRRRSIVRSTTGVISSTRPRLYLFVLVIYHTPSRRCGMRRATSLSSSPPHVRPPKRLRVSSCGLRAATGGHIAHARLNSLQVGQEGVGGDERGA